MNTNRPTKINEKGSIIIYTIMILITVVTISLALLKIVLPKFHIVRESIYSTIAFFAADSSVELCLFTGRIDTSGLATPPTQTLLLQNFTITGVNIVTTPASCPFNLAGTAQIRSVGTYRGISRSLEIF
jgi:hypothetical protein